MQPVLLTVNGTGTSAVVVTDYMQNPFNVGIGVTMTGGAGTAWRVEHTFQDFNPPTAAVNATTVWFVNSAIGTSTTFPLAVSTFTAMDMNYAFPVRGLRVNVLSATATSIVTATFVQASNAP